MCIILNKIGCFNILMIIFFSDFFLPVRSVDIAAVEGKRVSLACPLSPPDSDKVYMVLWFRDDAGIPLYRFVDNYFFLIHLSKQLLLYLCFSTKLFFIFNFFILSYQLIYLYFIFIFDGSPI